jgi:hypothetical protein
MLRNIWPEMNISWMPLMPQGRHMSRSTDMTKYLVSSYTFHLKQLACIFIGNEIIQFLYISCAYFGYPV